jgi:ubiquinone/menaquinone biosynthesis C-methylase UbiE
VSLSTADWHSRFCLQAQWTADIRHYILDKTNFENADCIIEIGCGTGAIFEDLSDQLWNYNLSSQETNRLFGLDIDYGFLDFTKNQNSAIMLINGDAHTLPINNNSFDITYCHFLLLWVANPQIVLSEMVRITKPGGFIIAFAEPDYGGRIDYPHRFARIGQMQAESLHLQGADPNIGRKLPELFKNINLVDINYGVLGGQWKNEFEESEWNSEWEIIKNDLYSNLTTQEIDDLKNIDKRARLNGIRVLYIPTFYAWVQVRNKK